MLRVFFFGGESRDHRALLRAEGTGRSIFSPCGLLRDNGATGTCQADPLQALRQDLLRVLELLARSGLLLRSLPSDGPAAVAQPRPETLSTDGPGP